jgi:hypothetical protein
VKLLWRCHLASAAPRILKFIFIIFIFHRKDFIFHNIALCYQKIIRFLLVVDTTGINNQWSVCTEAPFQWLCIDLRWDSLSRPAIEITWTSVGKGGEKRRRVTRGKKVFLHDRRDLIEQQKICCDGERSGWSIRMAAATLISQFPALNRD